VRFDLPKAARDLFRTAEAALVVDHPNERAWAVLGDATKQSLLGDLA
jgi:predicted NAD-dependent protein-ADP-ribosyltransferase YbiA (DUF1768 family)